MLTKTRDFVNWARPLLWPVSMALLGAWSAYNVGLILAHHGARPLQEFVSQSPAPRQGSGAHVDPRVVVSKASSSKKYHYVWCSGGTRIKPTNQVWFPTSDAAEAAGYTLAANCSR